MNKNGKKMCLLAVERISQILKDYNGTLMSYKLNSESLNLGSISMRNNNSYKGRPLKFPKSPSIRANPFLHGAHPFFFILFECSIYLFIK